MIDSNIAYVHQVHGVFFHHKFNIQFERFKYFFFLSIYICNVYCESYGSIWSFIETSISVCCPFGLILPNFSWRRSEHEQKPKLVFVEAEQTHKYLTSFKHLNHQHDQMFKFNPQLFVSHRYHGIEYEHVIMLKIQKFWNLSDG